MSEEFGAVLAGILVGSNLGIFIVLLVWHAEWLARGRGRNEGG